MAVLRPTPLLLLLGACEPATPPEAMLDDDWSLREDSGEPAGEDSGEGGEDSGGEQSELVEQVPGTGGSGYDGEENADLFTLDRVVSLDITLPDASVAALNADPYEYVEADIVIDGEEVPNVAIRLGGKYGSLRYLSQKAGFKIDIDRYDATRDWRGLERLVVKNMVQDYSFLHERIAFQVYEAMGVPAPRVGYLWVTVNGEAYGLYSNVEAMDDRFLARSYEDGRGNFYDGDYWLAEDWSTYQLLDFYPTTQDMMVLDEGEDVGHADVHAVTEAIRAASTGGDWMTDVGAVVDLEHHAAMMAVEFWVGQYDGYTNYTNNYRVYFDPTDGLAKISPWDHDWAFYDSNPMTPQYGLLSRGCYNDAACYALFQEKVVELCATLPGLDLEAEVDRGIELLRPYIAEDPRKEISAETAGSYQRHLRTWVTSRYATLASAYGVDCPTPE